MGLLYATIAVLQILRMVCEAQGKCCLQSTPFDFLSVSIRDVSFWSCDTLAHFSPNALVIWVLLLQ